MFDGKKECFVKPKEICKRYGLFVLSLWFSALGVAFTKCGSLGVSPVSSVANVLSLRFSALSMGDWLILWSVLLILGQIAVLRRRYQLIQLLQLPMAFLFGWFTDVGMLIAGLVPVNSYSMQLVMVVLGIVILGFGVALSVIANVMFNAGEGFVKALSDVTEKNFGDVKIAFDIFSVSLSVVLSLILFGGKVVGLREGTLIASICTGLAVKFFTKRLKTPLDQVLTR
ncbi:MAG: YitT family protein [Clostridia bacterium]|nr:YitT family protein [Clostridia bacterium]